MLLHSSRAILSAAFRAVAMFWNQLVVFHSAEDEDFLHHPSLIEMRRAFAAELNTMADVVTHKANYKPAFASGFFRLDYPRSSALRGVCSKYGESFRRVTGNRFKPERRVLGLGPP
jgi:hypothetical protein